MKNTKIFLNLNSQFDSNHAFKVPNPPPKKLVKIKSFNVPNISFLPEIPKEKLPLKTKLIPSIKKLKIGIINIIATINEAIFKGFKSLIIFFIFLIKIFKNQIKLYYASCLELNLQNLVDS